jgi:hypothetical protein
MELLSTFLLRRHLVMAPAQRHLVFNLEDYAGSSSDERRPRGKPEMYRPGR